MRQPTRGPRLRIDHDHVVTPGDRDPVLDGIDAVRLEGGERPVGLVQLPAQPIMAERISGHESPHVGSRLFSSEDDRVPPLQALKLIVLVDLKRRLDRRYDR